MLLTLGEDLLGLGQGVLTLVVDIINAAVPHAAVGGGGQYPFG